MLRASHVGRVALTDLVMLAERTDLKQFLLCAVKCSFDAFLLSHVCPLSASYCNRSKKGLAGIAALNCLRLAVLNSNELFLFSRLVTLLLRRPQNTAVI